MVIWILMLIIGWCEDKVEGVCVVVVYWIGEL